MLTVKSIYTVGLCALLGAYRPTPFGGASHPERIKWLVEKASTMSIAGSTNINKFCCQITQYSGPDTLMTVRETGGIRETEVSFQGILGIDINDFDCRNGVMTSEFKHILKSQEHPLLIIRFLSLDRLPLEESGNGDAGSPNNAIVKGWVEVELAGVCRKFEITYSSCRHGSNSLEIVGVRTLGFSDFGLLAPRKMGGLVRVHDELNVQFRLCLHRIN
jgi:hypothetical protein